MFCKIFYEDVVCPQDTSPSSPKSTSTSKSVFMRDVNSSQTSQRWQSVSTCKVWRLCPLCKHLSLQRGTFSCWIMFLAFFFECLRPKNHCGYENVSQCFFFIRLWDIKVLWINGLFWVASINKWNWKISWGEFLGSSGVVQWIRWLESIPKSDGVDADWQNYLENLE